MKLRTAALILTLGFLLAPLAAEAQQPGKVYRVGLIFNTSPVSEMAGPEPVHPLARAFLHELRALGYVEEKNLVLERRSAEGKFERLPDIAAELVSLKVDLIVAVATPAALAAKNATKTIPIVMVAVADPVGSGLIASLARPGGNITGLSLLAGLEIIGKHLELLKETVPNVSRVAVLWNPANQHHHLRLKEAEVAGRSLGVQLQIVAARGPDEFESAFAAMTRERAGALVVFADPMFFPHRTRLADLAAKSRLPAAYEFKEHVEAGGLMAYGPSVPDQFRRAATYVHRILRGTKPSDLPVEQPTRFTLIINLATAKALGLTIPQTVLFRADKVIE